MRRCGLALIVVIGGFVAFERAPVVAHKTVVSKFTFNKDVQPILVRRCLPCHASGSAVPLQTYADARVQSWPLRQALVSGRMPPYYAEPGDVALKDSEALSPRELDVLMTWASGGTPEGPARPSLPMPAHDSPAAPDNRQDIETIEVPADGLRLERDIQVLAVRAVTGPPGSRVRLVAVRPDGSRLHLIDLRIEPAWPRRYAFVRPIAVPAGSRFQGLLGAHDAALWRPLLGGPLTETTKIVSLSTVLELIR